MAVQNRDSEFSELFNQEEIPQEPVPDVPRIDAQTTDSSFNSILEMLRPSSIVKSVDDVLGRESFPAGAALLGSLMQSLDRSSPIVSENGSLLPPVTGRGDASASPSGSGELALPVAKPATEQPLPAAKPAAGHGDASPIVSENGSLLPPVIGRGDASASPSGSGELALPAAKPAAGHGDASPVVPGNTSVLPPVIGRGDASASPSGSGEVALPAAKPAAGHGDALPTAPESGSLPPVIGRGDASASPSGSGELALPAAKPATEHTLPAAKPAAGHGDASPIVSENGSLLPPVIGRGDASASPSGSGELPLPAAKPATEQPLPAAKPAAGNGDTPASLSSLTSLIKPSESGSPTESPTVSPTIHNPVKPPTSGTNSGESGELPPVAPTTLQGLANLMTNAPRVAAPSGDGSLSPTDTKVLPPASPVHVPTSGFGNTKPASSGNSESGEIPNVVAPTLQGMMTNVFVPPTRNSAPSGEEALVPASPKSPTPSTAKAIEGGILPPATTGTGFGESTAGALSNLVAPSPTKEVSLPVAPGDAKASPLPANYVHNPAPSGGEVIPSPVRTNGDTSSGTLGSLLKPIVANEIPGDAKASPLPTNYSHNPVPTTGTSDSSSPVPVTGTIPNVVPRETTPIPTTGTTLQNVIQDAPAQSTPIRTLIANTSDEAPRVVVANVQPRETENTPVAPAREVPSISPTSATTPTYTTSAETALSNLVAAMAAVTATSAAREAVREGESNMVAPSRDTHISPQEITVPQQQIAISSRDQTVSYTRDFTSIFAKEAMVLNYSIKDISSLTGKDSVTTPSRDGTVVITGKDAAPVSGKDLITAISAKDDHRILLIGGESITGKNITLEGVGKISTGDKSILITITDGGVKVPGQSHLPVGQAIIIPLDGKTGKFSDLTQSDKVPLDSSVVVTGPRINPILVNGNSQPSGPNTDPSSADPSAGIAGTPAGSAPPQVQTYDDGIIINTNNGWQYIPGGELREDFTVVTPSGAVWMPSSTGVYVEVIDSFTITDEEKEERERERAKELAEEQAREEKREQELIQERRRRDEQLLVAELGTKRRQPLVTDEPRKRYYVKQGDTLESIATKELKNRQLAYLIYQINKMWIGLKVKDGKRIPQLKVGMLLYLPSRMDTEVYRSNVRHAKRPAIEIAVVS